VSTRLLTVPEVADLLRVNTDTVRRLAREGELRGIKPASRWRFTRAAVDAFLEKSVPAEPEPQEQEPVVRRRRRRAA